MSVRIDTIEMKAYSAKLIRASGTIGATASAVLRKTAFDIEADAKILAPVDTGTLMNSISTTITGDGRTGLMTAEIGPTVDYAIYQEFGTSTQPGKPFMTPAYDRRIPGFEQALGQIAERGL